MADKSNDGSIRISGRFGEVFLVERPLRFPDGTPIPGPPVGVKLIEFETIEATTERTFVDVNIPGEGDTGRKPGPTTRNGTATIQHIFPDWQAFVKRTQFSGTLDQRRRARDAGQRFSAQLVMQVWNDDPTALGAEGWQLEGWETARLTMGFSQDDTLSRELPFAYDDETEIRGYQRINGGGADPVTGLPAITYFAGAPVA